MLPGGQDRAVTHVNRLLLVRLAFNRGGGKWISHTTGITCACTLCKSWIGTSPKQSHRPGVGQLVRSDKEDFPGVGNSSSRPRSCGKHDFRCGCCATAVARAGRRARSGRDRLHQRVEAEDIDHSQPAGHIVNQEIKGPSQQSPCHHGQYTQDNRPKYQSHWPSSRNPGADWNIAVARNRSWLQI